MQTFFTSDLHFGHKNIIKFCNRPFKDVDEMNEMLITYWNETVPVGSKVYVLGDFALGKIAETLPLAKRLHGDLHLVPGNHDRCWMGNKKYHNWTQRYIDAGFKLSPKQVCTRINKNPNHNVTLCHFPRIESANRYDDRYKEYHVGPTTDWVLHGHVHDTWRLDVQNRQINVGCDVWDYRPVSAETLGIIIDEVDGN